VLVDNHGKSRRPSLVFGVSFSLLGCASSSDKITASYVLPMQCDAHNCRQLRLTRLRKPIIRQLTREDNVICGP
jgi:hypothetical protein